MEGQVIAVMFYKDALQLYVNADALQLCVNAVLRELHFVIDLEHLHPVSSKNSILPSQKLFY